MVAVLPRPSGNRVLAQAGAGIGRFKLLLPIGVGGMAQVWAAAPQGVGLARAVALKLILPEFGALKEYERMFVDEAMVTSAIHHPNVCEVRELARDGDRLYMILELVLGDSLAGILKQGAKYEPLPYPIAARVVSEACAGLDAAHNTLARDGRPLDIVHRDVSPPNVLLSINGHVKVSDFGIAKARYQLHSRTRTGQIKGKFAYIPPEQIIGKGVDRRADVYALGCLLYITTTGHRPFGTGTEALGRIVKGTYCLPSEIHDDYPPGLELIITRALQPTPDRRYQTAREMRLALESWLVDCGHLVMDTDVGRAVRERLSSERLAVVEALMRSDRQLPEELTRRVLVPSDRIDAPTASQRPSEITRSDVSGTDGGRKSDTPTWRPKAKGKGDGGTEHIMMPPAGSTGFSENAGPSDSTGTRQATPSKEDAGENTKSAERNSASG